MPNYEVWTFHGESASRAAPAEVDDGDRSDYDRMDEMLDDIRPEFDLDSEDPPTPEVQKFFEALKASEEPLHAHTKVNILAFVTRLMSIKSKYAFPNSCYNEIVKLFDDVFPQPHKMPLDMYHAKRLCATLGMEHQKIDMCQDNCMLFWKVDKDENKCLKCGKPRFVEIEKEDGTKEMTGVAHKQLRYMPITPRLKWLYLSKKNAMHMRWHKEGVHESEGVMVHPFDSEAWKALDSFDPDFAQDARNVRIGLATDGFTPFT
jgi:hypothetical protein